MPECTTPAAGRGSNGAVVTTTAPGLLRVRIDGPVAFVTLDRPDRLNALSRRLVMSLTTVVEDLVATPAVRVLVLVGEGRMFSAGADVDEIRADAARGGASTEEMVTDARRGERLCAALQHPDLVTIAAVHGHAVGGAAAVVAACDLRMFAQDARLVVPELAMGIPIAWGGVERLARDLGPAVVRDLLLTGRALKADEALARGFANAVVPTADLLEHVTAYAELIASRPRLGASAALRRVLAVVDRSGVPGMDDDAATLALAALDPDVVSATASYLQSLSGRSSGGGRNDR